MKLHFDKSWIRQFDEEELNEEVGTGAPLTSDAALALMGEHKPAVNNPVWPRALSTLLKRGWIQEEALAPHKAAFEVLQEFLLPVQRIKALSSMHWRRTLAKNNRQEELNEILTTLWIAQASRIARDSAVRAPFDLSSLEPEFMSRLARLSTSQNGPNKAKQQLANIGLSLVFEPAFQGARIDGASFLIEESHPVIALSLRYDRVDYFWFTLFHELAHIKRHVFSQKRMFVDDISVVDVLNDPVEREADRLARDFLIPRQVWRRCAAYTDRTESSIKETANELGIHAAIVAGRLRYELKRYDWFPKLVGQGEILRHILPS